mgnify:CR=1 FL=1
MRPFRLYGRRICRSGETGDNQSDSFGGSGLSENGLLRDTVSIDAYIKEYNGIKLTVGYEVKDDRTGMVHCRGTSKHCFIDKTGRPLVLRKSFPELNEAFEAGVKIHKENKKALIKKREDK